MLTLELGAPKMSPNLHIKRKPKELEMTMLRRFWELMGWAAGSSGRFSPTRNIETTLGLTLPQLLPLFSKHVVESCRKQGCGHNLLQILGNFVTEVNFHHCI